MSMKSKFPDAVIAGSGRVHLVTGSVCKAGAGGETCDLRVSKKYLFRLLHEAGQGDIYNFTIHLGHCFRTCKVSVIPVSAGLVSMQDRAD